MRTQAERFVSASVLRQTARREEERERGEGDEISERE
jgi:hypothetical protein